MKNPNRHLESILSFDTQYFDEFDGLTENDNMRDLESTYQGINLKNKGTTEMLMGDSGSIDFASLKVPEYIKKLSIKSPLDRIKESEPSMITFNPENKASLVRKASSEYEIKDEKACQCNQILIVDDLAFNLLAVELMLDKKFHIKPDKALSGDQAIQKVKDRLQNE